MTLVVWHPSAVFHVGDVVRKLRTGRKWSVEDLAEKAGVNKMTVSAIERGHGYRRDSLDRIAKALGADLRHLHLLAEAETVLETAKEELASSEEEREVLRLWRAIPAHNRVLLRASMETMARPAPTAARPNDELVALLDQLDDHRRDVALRTLRNMLAHQPPTAAPAADSGGDVERTSQRRQAGSRGPGQSS